MDERKKTIFVGVLFVVMVVVGIVQFLRMSAAPTVSSSPAPKPPPAPVAAEAAPDATKPGELKNPGLYPLPARDPFKSPFPPQDQVVASNPHPAPISKPSKGLSGTLPGVGDLAVHPQVDTAPPPEPTFDYTVSGIVVGRHPLVSFEDKSGHQRLVELGQRIDPESRVLYIDPHQVIVSFNWAKGKVKELKLKINGGPVAKQ
jgi:hypothetical protein